MASTTLSAACDMLLWWEVLLFLCTTDGDRVIIDAGDVSEVLTMLDQCKMRRSGRVRSPHHGEYLSRGCYDGIRILYIKFDPR